VSDAAPTVPAIERMRRVSKADILLSSRASSDTSLPSIPEILLSSRGLELGQARVQHVLRHHLPDDELLHGLGMGLRHLRIDADLLQSPLVNRRPEGHGKRPLFRSEHLVLARPIEQGRGGKLKTLCWKRKAGDCTSPRAGR
jgi:hypothetical protein